MPADTATVRKSSKPLERLFPTMLQRDDPYPEDQIHQASCSAGVNKGMAILDTGASRSVIGVDHVPALLKKLPECVRSRVKEKPSKDRFPFWEQPSGLQFQTTSDSADPGQVEDLVAC